MEDDNLESPRELRWWVAGLLVALAGIVGGAVGILTALFWIAIIPGIIGLNQFTATWYMVSPALVFIMGPTGAMLGGWISGRYIDKFERRSPPLTFRDERAGGAITLFIKVLTWTSFLLMGSALIFLLRRG